MKDQLLRQLEGQLKKEKEDRERQQRYGLSPEELQSRLAWSQSDLAHTRYGRRRARLRISHAWSPLACLKPLICPLSSTRALLDLFNLRIAGAMEAIAVYKV